MLNTHSDAPWKSILPTFASFFAVLLLDASLHPSRVVACYFPWPLRLMLKFPAFCIESVKLKDSSAERNKLLPSLNLLMEIWEKRFLLWSHLQWSKKRFWIFEFWFFHLLVRLVYKRIGLLPYAIWLLWLWKNKIRPIWLLLVILFMIFSIIAFPLIWFWG